MSFSGTVWIKRPFRLALSWHCTEKDEWATKAANTILSLIIIIIIFWEFRNKQACWLCQMQGHGTVIPFGCYPVCDQDRSVWSFIRIFVCFINSVLRSFVRVYVFRSWWTSAKTLRQTVRQVQSVMTCFTGKLPLWGPKTRPTQVESFFLTFISLLTIHSRYVICCWDRLIDWFAVVAGTDERFCVSFSLLLSVPFHDSHPKFTLRRAFITATSTRTVAFVLTFWRTSGVRRWLSARCCWVFVLSWPIPTPMTRWFPILLSYSRPTGLGTIVRRENGRPNMPCSIAWLIDCSLVDPFLLRSFNTHTTVVAAAITANNKPTFRTYL